MEKEGFAVQNWRLPDILRPLHAGLGASWGVHARLQLHHGATPAARQELLPPSMKQLLGRWACWISGHLITRPGSRVLQFSLGDTQMRSFSSMMWNCSHFSTPLCCVWLRWGWGSRDQPGPIFGIQRANASPVWCFWCQASLFFQVCDECGS